MAYLTIDDAPSALFSLKLDFLRRRNIPAWFFCWGEKIAGKEALLIDALHTGCLLGNHSWTHPHFSELTLEQAREEISRTDQALADLYHRAGIPWAKKAFRFPYLDQGSSPEQRASLQDLLAEFDYACPPNCPGTGRDAGISFDQREYWIGKPDAPHGSSELSQVLGRIVQGQPGSNDVILIHDHESTHEVFFQCVDRYRELGLHFTLL